MTITDYKQRGDSYNLSHFYDLISGELQETLLPARKFMLSVLLTDEKPERLGLDSVYVSVEDKIFIPEPTIVIERER